MFLFELKVTVQLFIIKWFLRPPVLILFQRNESQMVVYFDHNYLSFSFSSFCLRQWHFPIELLYLGWLLKRSIKGILYQKTQNPSRNSNPGALEHKAVMQRLSSNFYFPTSTCGYINYIINKNAPFISKNIFKTLFLVNFVVLTVICNIKDMSCVRFDCRFRLTLFRNVWLKTNQCS